MDNDTIDRLRELAGYIENGTDTTVTFFQDDATRSWVVKVGNKSFRDYSLREALMAAYDAVKQF